MPSADLLLLLQRAGVIRDDVFNDQALIDPLEIEYLAQEIARQLWRHDKLQGRLVCDAGAVLALPGAERLGNNLARHLALSYRQNLREPRRVLDLSMTNSRAQPQNIPLELTEQVRELIKDQQVVVVVNVLSDTSVGKLKEVIRAVCGETRTVGVATFYNQDGIQPEDLGLPREGGRIICALDSLH